MSVTFPITTALNALRAQAKTTFSLADSTPIPEAGSDPIDLTSARLPMAVMATQGGAQVGRMSEEQGAALRDVTTLFSVDVWLIREKTAGTADVESLRDDDLAPLAAALVTDDRLSGTATSVDVTEINWTGEGKEWPFILSEAQGAIAGYVSASILLVESR